MRTSMGQPIAQQNGLRHGEPERLGECYRMFAAGGLAIQDLVAGQFDFMFASAGDSGEQVRGRSIKAFAVMAENRLASAPDIPTVDEAGLPGFYHTALSPFRRQNPREEPGALAAHAGIRAGGGWQQPLLPRPRGQKG
jgi:hypothetical protein